ncbi:hypothetical protein FE257_007548 [Aspergillus nanangensis]|uniref:DUF455 domain protein n=1 Tax=Aspergillus nanangensis TaxID=2582783 RepID=A0AAD4CMG4_ASPNN|nr:hypothetical protein FE257_007548 [Aspergillus nanangensis]
MQGFNMGRYVPPDQEGLTTGNKLSGKHPLGARARHLNTTGALTVRFEMPFAVWCTTCKPQETLIGQGVRFNAEKKKIGNYYSTPIYSFRMRHAPCGGWIEIRTDPQNTAYVVAEGGRKRDTGENKELGVGEIAIKLPGEESGATVDPFARLEGKVEDKRKTETQQSRILDLQRRQEKDWHDPYENSKRLRRSFRAERKVLENAEARSEALKDKMSLGIDLVEETEEDRMRAGFVDFGAGLETNRTRTRPMFEPGTSTSSGKGGESGPGSGRRSGKRSKKPRAADVLAERKALFRSELSGNTRAAVDPFLSSSGDPWRPEIKRRKAGVPDRGDESHNKVAGNGDTGVAGNVSTLPSNGSSVDEQGIVNKPTVAGATLVDYASDSE